MIEIEPMASVMSDEALRLVALFCGQEVKDKLLFEEEAYDGILRNLARDAIGRADVVNRRGCDTRSIENYRRQA